MRKTLPFAGVFFLIVVLIILGINTAPAAADKAYLRIHIRADSNLVGDQNIKYAVKDAIVDYLAPYICGVSSYAECREVIRKHLRDIETVADKVLKCGGKTYSARAELKDKEFPARAYGELVLESGVYDALIVYLGSGAGDNWWCVIYPPLCFVNAQGADSDGITYKSKIAEIIRKITGK